MQAAQRTLWLLYRDTLEGFEVLAKHPTVGFRRPVRDEPWTNFWSFESEGHARMIRKHLKTTAHIERRSKLRSRIRSEAQ
jgi:hypothetical protein